MQGLQNVKNALQVNIPKKELLIAIIVLKEHIHLVVLVNALLVQKEHIH
jgi:hypothetical protein